MHACVCAHLHSEFLKVEVQYVRGGADSSLSLVVLGWAQPGLNVLPKTIIIMKSK